MDASRSQAATSLAVDAPGSSTGLGPLSFPLLPENEKWNRRCERLAWTFVAVGIALRLGRYLLRYPLWGDELMLAGSFLERDYADMLRPLDSLMIAPLLFLWAEVTAIKLGGYSEWTLRLFPLLNGIVGLVVFRHLAGRLMRGVPLLIATAMLALAYYPIRHASEMRPYASDLTVAVLLVAGAVEWLREPSRSRYLWALALFGPLAVGTSYPAVFVAGAVSVGLAWPVWKQRNRGVTVAFVAYNLAIVASFLLFLKLAAAAQYQNSSGEMTRQWAYAFPPLAEPWRVPNWLLTVLCGEMFAYPFGGDRSASIATTLCFAVGCFVLYRTKRYTLLTMTVAVFGLALVAASLHRYPFAGERCMQYLAPFICAGAGLGGGFLIAASRKARTQRHVLIGLNVGFAAIAIGMGTYFMLVPYKHRVDAVHRGFARWFWEQQSVGADVVCLRSDEGRDFGTYPNSLYLCNQRIYAPPRDKNAAVATVAETKEGAPKKLRCVAFQTHTEIRDEAAVAAWLKEMEAKYVLSDRQEYRVQINIPRLPEEIGIYEVFEFTPKTIAAAETARRP